MDLTAQKHFSSPMWKGVGGGQKVILWGLQGDFITYSQLTKIIGHWQLIQSPAPHPSPKSRGDAQSFNPLITWAGSPSIQLPPMGRMQKSPSLNHFQELETRGQIVSHCSYCSGNSKCLGTRETGTVNKDQKHVKYVFILVFIGKITILQAPTVD